MQPKEQKGSNTTIEEIEKTNKEKEQKKKRKKSPFEINKNEIKMQKDEQFNEENQENTKSKS